MGKGKADDTRLRIDITLDGQSYVWEPYEVPAHVEMELYDQSQRMGHAIDTRELFSELGNWTPFQTAAAVFVVRRTRGDAVTYREIATALGWGNEAMVDVVTGEDAEGDGPKDQAAS